MPNDKQKTKVYKNQDKFNKANQAYQDSLRYYNLAEEAVRIALKNSRSMPNPIFKKSENQKQNFGNPEMLPIEVDDIGNSNNINGNTNYIRGIVQYPRYKKPTTKPIYQPDTKPTETVKPTKVIPQDKKKSTVIFKDKPKIEPIKLLGIKPIDSMSKEPELNLKPIIQEPMSKKQTYTAAPILKKMGKSTGREYVDGKWVETKSKGGTIKKYVTGGTFSNYFKSDAGMSDIKSAVGGLPNLGAGTQQPNAQDPNTPVKKNTGKSIGNVAGTVAGLALAPFTGGISTVVGPMLGSTIGGAIDNKQYKNKVEDYTTTKSSQQNAMTSNIAGNFNPNAQGKQFKKGGMIKRADGSYSKRGLWDNIRDNAGSGKQPTKEMLEQEKKIKAKYAQGGKVKLTADGEKHIIYKKESPTGMGKGKEGHIMVNHPTKDKGKWDTIDLTEKAGAKTVAQGVAATKKWHEENPMEYKKGGIYIKPENRGKFTATKKATGKTTEELTHSKNPLTRKRAIFAQNAAKWHHANGGKVIGKDETKITPNLHLNNNFKTETPTISPSGFLVKDPSGMFIGGAGLNYRGDNNLSVSPYIVGVGNENFKKIPADYGIKASRPFNNITPYINIGKNPSAGMSIKFEEGGKVPNNSGFEALPKKIQKKIIANMAMGGVDTSNSMSGPKYAKGGELKPMGNDMYEVKSYKKGTDKVEYKPNVFIDDKEIIRKNPDGSTQILSDDLGYAKVAKSLAKAKGGNISDNQFDQLYMAQEMSKTNKGKGNKFVTGGLEDTYIINPNLLPSNNMQSIESGYSPNKFKIDSNKGLILNPDKKQPGSFDVKAPSVDLQASKFIGETKGKYNYKFSPANPNITPLDTKVNPLGYLSSLAGPAYTIAQGLKGPDPVDFDRMNTKYQFADPRGAMAAASRGVTSAYNAAKNAARTTATSAGEYLANMGTLAGKEGIDRAAALANIKAQYDMANTQGLNQTNLTKDQFNAQVQMNESIARQQEKDAARGSISSGLTGLGQNTMGYMADREANKTQRRMIDLINSGEYEYVEDANGRIQLLPKKGRKSSSVEITAPPTGK